MPESDDDLSSLSSEEELDEDLPEYDFSIVDFHDETGSASHFGVLKAVKRFAGVAVVKLRSVMKLRSVVRKLRRRRALGGVKYQRMVCSTHGPESSHNPLALSSRPSSDGTGSLESAGVESAEV